MSSETDLRNRLINHLDGLAGYNDKGQYWSRHSPEQIREQQKQAQIIILKLLAQIGEKSFSTDLLRKLKSGAASVDGSGNILLQAKRELL